MRMDHSCGCRYPYPASWGRIRRAGSLHQILGIYGGPERTVVGNEFGDEFMQAGLKYLVHPAVLQAGADGAGLTLRLALAAIGGGDRVAEAHQVFVAARQRARHLLIE